MRKLVFIAIMLLFATPAWSLDVSQIVFSITSTAATATPNLRITPMRPRMLNFNGGAVQTFALDQSTTLNYYLTKSQTVTIPTNGTYGVLWIQIDQDTQMKKNSDSVYMLLKSGVDYTLGLQ